MAPTPDLSRLLRRTDTVRPADELAPRLAEGKKLRVKLGLDPTAPAVTLGWAVVLRKLRDFQEQGHTAVLIVGDFTAQVGDPSQKSETRRRLSAEEVRGHAQAVLTQFQKVLLPEPLEIRYNSEWLGSLDMTKVLELTSTVTVAQLLERGDFAKRFESRSPISVMEFMYPLLQGYDSVAIEADVELGGTDQLWNLMMGRVVQERFGQRPQVAMTMPLLIGTDGVHKMSQSLNNYIGVSDPPDEIFGKVMSILPNSRKPKSGAWWPNSKKELCTLAKPSAFWPALWSACTGAMRRPLLPRRHLTACSEIMKRRPRCRLQPYRTVIRSICRPYCGIWDWFRPVPKPAD
jgi:tyrosyl-tRNA synthetase